MGGACRKEVAVYSAPISFEEHKLGQTSLLAGEVQNDVWFACGARLLEAAAKGSTQLSHFAFLIGAVAASASTAVMLGADCIRFRQVLETAEGILSDTSDIDPTDPSQAEGADVLRQALDDTMMFLHKLQRRNPALYLILARESATKLGNFRDEVARGLSLLRPAAVASGGIADVSGAEFLQSARVTSRLDELGGPDVVMPDPSLLRELERLIDLRDYDGLASMGSSALPPAPLARHSTMGETEAEAWKTALHTVPSSMAEADRLRTINTCLVRYAGELKFMMEKQMLVPSRFAVRFPVPGDEVDRSVAAERFAVLRAAASQAIDSALEAAVRGLGVVAAGVELVGPSTSSIAISLRSLAYTAALSAPPSDAADLEHWGMDGEAVLVRGGREAFPRKFGPLQLVVFRGGAAGPGPASGGAGQTHLDPAMPQYIRLTNKEIRTSYSFDDLGTALSLKDAAVSDFISRGGLPAGSMLASIAQAVRKDDTLICDGVPVRLGGKITGALLLFHRGLDLTTGWPEHVAPAIRTIEEDLVRQAAAAHAPPSSAKSHGNGHASLDLSASSAKASGGLGKRLSKSKLQT